MLSPGTVNRMRMALSFYLSKISHPFLITGKPSDTLTLKNVQQITRPGLLSTVKVTKNKEGLRNSPRLGEPKEM